MADLTSDPAITTCFGVVINGHDLGVFTSFDGLGVQVETETRTEGGNHDFVHTLPVRLKYNNVKLTRPLNGDSAKVAAWLATMAGTIKRTTADITALTLEGTTIASWRLAGVIPVSWQGPSFNVDGPKAATETLELAHNGFLVG